MITIIAEKPSVAMEIARIVGARNREDGFMSGNGYAVTWALGHLVEIWSEKGDDWNASLPVLPEQFRLRVGQKRGSDGKLTDNEAYVKQLNVIRRLFASSEYIVNAGDAGREGELIQRYIYRFIGSGVPVRRLWISSLTDESIRDGLRNLRPSSEFDNLYLAGKARNEADWLVGINATRAMTASSGMDRVISMGRVQTPTFALVCRRYIENRDFVRVPFWTLEVKSLAGYDAFMSKSERRYDSRDEAYSALVEVQDAGSLKVDKVTRKQVNSQPPLPFDLTSLQREANKRFSMSAQQTLSAAQSLYESKLITYPRTGSRYITEDVFRTIPSLLARLAADDPTLPVASLLDKGLNRRCVNGAKVTDHHALLPTGNSPGQIGPDERRIYGLIVTRLLETLSPVCEKVVTTVNLSTSGVGFVSHGVMIVSPGWTSVRNEKEEQKDDDGNVITQTLPVLMEGDMCRIIDSDLSEGCTKPKPLYTEDTLLDAMEHAGREIDDQQLKEAIRDCGLGTPATRAAEIETIIKRGYVERKGKSLVPTGLGLALYDAVKDMSIADAELTAKWESALSEIAEGRRSEAEFDKQIREYAEKIVTELLNNGDIASSFSSIQSVPDASCPVCGKKIVLSEKIARCADMACGWKVWRTVCGHYLSDSEMKDLLCERRTKEIHGLLSKEGKTFSACIVLNEENRQVFSFVNHDLDSSGNVLPCPRCGKPLHLREKGAFCSDRGCGWVLWREMAGKKLSDTVLRSLIARRSSGVINGFTGKSGKTFSASLILDNNGEVQFKFSNSGGHGRSLKKKKW